MLVKIGWIAVMGVSFSAFKMTAMKNKAASGKWAEEAEALRARSVALQPGPDRDKLLRQARQLEIASKIDDWLTSPGLKKPT